MNPDDLERRLTDAFAAQARASIGDDRLAPPLDLSRPQIPRSRRLGRVLAPIAVAAAVAAFAVGIALHQSHSTHHEASIRFPSATTVSSPAATEVRDTFAMKDGTQVGVGMPVVAYFSAKITDARTLQAVTRVTVNNKPVEAAWYFEPTTDVKDYPLEGHLRLQSYWPAHSVVQVTVPAAGLSAGPGFQLADDLNLTFRTGATNLAVVSDSTHLMTVTSDDKTLGSFPVSLGTNLTPTDSGIKVIMAKGASICMSGPGYHLCDIKYTQRLTYSGEYLHAAPWNEGNIKSGIDSSNGCTNLMPSDAALLYKVLEVGDVVEYPKTDGPAMTVGDGYGDWNVPWGTWQAGGSIPTH